jgi:mRNA interferase HigB
MTLVGEHVLLAAGRKNAPLRKWLDVWINMVEQAAWKNLEDVRSTFRSADGVALPSGRVVTVFNVKGGHYRLLTVIDYQIQSLETLEIITHAAYSKQLWKARY